MKNNDKSISFGKKLGIFFLRMMAFLLTFIIVLVVTLMISLKMFCSDSADLCYDYS